MFLSAIQSVHCKKGLLKKYSLTCFYTEVIAFVAGLESPQKVLPNMINPKVHTFHSILVCVILLSLCLWWTCHNFHTRLALSQWLSNYYYCYFGGHLKVYSYEKLAKNHFYHFNSLDGQYIIDSWPRGNKIQWIPVAEIEFSLMHWKSKFCHIVPANAKHLWMIWAND